MKILQVLHGFPAELVGGTERAVDALARAQVRMGHEVTVVAGSLDWQRGFVLREDRDAGPEGLRADGVRIYRLHRGDIYFEHWHQHRSVIVRKLFEEALAFAQPDVVHVHHWLRLSVDLVQAAARAGIPALVSLHDLWSTCLIGHRVRPGTDRLCEVPLAANPCLECAGSQPPFTHWMDGLSGAMRLEQRKSDLKAELTSAHRVVVPSRAHGELVRRFLELPEDLEFAPVRPVGGAWVPRREATPDPNARPLELALFGHLSPEKGPDLAIDAIAALAEPRRVRLHLMGGAVRQDFEDELRSKAKDLDVVFHGAYEIDHLAQHPAAGSHALLSCSRAHESWGLVVDEALNLGLPALLPRSGAFVERATDQPWAALYEPGDRSSLTQLIEGLLADPERLAALQAGVPDIESLRWEPDDQAALLDPLYRAAAQAGPPNLSPKDWWADRIAEQERQDWQRAITESTAQQLGLED